MTGVSPEQLDSQEQPAHLQLATAATLSLLALWVIGRIIKRRGRPGTRGSKGEVPSGDESASVHVVGENIVANEFTEEQNQIKEFHPLALTSGVRCRERRQTAELGRTPERWAQKERHTSNRVFLEGPGDGHTEGMIAMMGEKKKTWLRGKVWLVTPVYYSILRLRKK